VAEEVGHLKEGQQLLLGGGGRAHLSSPPPGGKGVGRVPAADSQHPHYILSFHYISFELELIAEARTHQLRGASPPARGHLAGALAPAAVGVHSWPAFSMMQVGMALYLVGFVVKGLFPFCVISEFLLHGVYRLLYVFVRDFGGLFKWAAQRGACSRLSSGEFHPLHGRAKACWLVALCVCYCKAALLASSRGRASSTPRPGSASRMPSRWPIGSTAAGRQWLTYTGIATLTSSGLPGPTPRTSARRYSTPSSSPRRSATSSGCLWRTSASLSACEGHGLAGPTARPVVWCVQFVAASVIWSVPLIRWLFIVVPGLGAGFVDTPVHNQVRAQLHS